MITMKLKEKQEISLVIDKKSSTKLTWLTLFVVFLGKYLDENHDRIFGIYGWKFFRRK